MTDKVKQLSEMVEEYPGNPDRVYMDTTHFHIISQEASVTGGGIPRVEDCRLFGMNVIITEPYGRNEMLVLDSDDYPKARDFKEGRVSAEKL